MIYFDNAATTGKKPREVMRAVRASIKNFSANPGRSSHIAAAYAAEKVFETREAICAHFHYSKPERVVFTLNATYALNLAIKGLIPDGAHVIISDIEHNSVLRPIEAMVKKRGVEYSVYSSDAEDVCCEIARHLNPNTSAIISTLCSNVTGKEVSFEALSRAKQKYNLRLILDASQAAGHKDINLSKYSFDAFAAPAHKALFGVMGAGFCIFGEGVDDIEPIIEGGSGGGSISSVMPPHLPERLEAGTVAVPAIIALGAGVNYIERIGIEKISQKLDRLTDHAAIGLSSPDSIKLYGAANGVVAFNVKGVDSERVAEELNTLGICVRAGLHCAPLTHRKMGTLDGGAVRVSFSYFNTDREIERFISIIKKICR